MTVKVFTGPVQQHHYTYKLSN